LSSVTSRGSPTSKSVSFPADAHPDARTSGVTDLDRKRTGVLACQKGAVPNPSTGIATPAANAPPMAAIARRKNARRDRSTVSIS
jgi:hypothetical protein